MLDKSLSPVNLKNGDENGFKTRCSKVGGPDAYLKVQEVGDKFFENFNAKVEHSINKTNLEFNLKMLVPSIFEYVYVANKSCYNDIVNRERDALEFYKLVEFSIRTGPFQDFIDSGGVECIEAVKDKISGCVKTEVGELNRDNKFRKYDSFWEMTGLIITNRSCKATNRIKLCTQQAMRDEGYYKCKYQNYNVLYVGSLFDFILERCSRLYPGWMESNTVNLPNTNACATYASITVLSILAILAFVYICVHQCRKRIQWETFSERVSISMTNRWRTLVNN